MRRIVRNAKLMDILDGTKPCLEENITIGGLQTSNLEYQKWVNGDDCLQNGLLATLSQALVTEVSSFTTVAQIWTLLTERYTILSQSQTFQLKDELDELRLEKFSKMDDYLDEIKRITGKLALANEPIKDSSLVFQILKTLPSEYIVTKNMVRVQNTPTSFEQLCQLLRSEEINIKNNHKALKTKHLSLSQPIKQTPILPIPPINPTIEGDVVLTEEGVTITTMAEAISTMEVSKFEQQGGYMNNGGGGGRNFNNSKGGGRFWNRGRSGFQGGFQSSAQKWYNNYTPQTSPTGMYCNDCDRIHQSTSNCWFNPQAQQGNQAYTASSSGSINDCYLDFGTNNHIMKDMNQSYMQYPYHDNQSIIVGNGKELEIQHMGSGIHPTPTQKFFLHNILHVPDIASNLISVYHLTKDNDCSILFNAYGFVIQDNTLKRILLKGPCNNDMYPLLPNLH